MLSRPYFASHSEKNLGLFKQEVRLIKEQRKNIPPSSDQQILKLPEGFTIGKALDEGDCFFDAVAQGLKQLKPEMNFTVKSLREVCKKQALDKQEIKGKIIKDARYCINEKRELPHPGISDDELWNTYSNGVVYTAQDVAEMKDKIPSLYQSLTDLRYGSTLKIPIWGRPEIEGKMICSEYNVRLHIIEDLPVCGWSGSLIDGLGSKHVSTDYNEKDTIHVINKGYAHFEPILRGEAQQILPYSDLTQVQGMLKELSLGQIHGKLSNIMENCNLLEREKIEKLNFFFKAHPKLDVNFQVNQRGDTLLHIAVRNDELKVIRFLLRKRANTGVSNMEGKTSIDIARSNNRKGIAKVLQPLVSYKKIDVPGDGSCLFWSVALAYLTPVKFDNNKFCERFYKLFGDGYDVQIIQRLIQDDVDICQNDTLRWLIERIFRKRVVKEMRSFQEELKDEISMTDFFESKNEDYITNGSFKVKFLFYFGSEIEVKQQYGIESSKLQPSHFNSNAMDDICIELEKINNPKKVRKFQFEAYLECMKSPKAWGGTYEIKAMSQLLGTVITLCKENSSETHGEQRECHNKIRLSYKNRNHCQFYQTEYSNLVKFVQSFVQSFEMKLIIYSTFGEMVRREKEVLPKEITNKNFVRSIFGFSVRAGVRTISGERACRSGNFSCLSDLIETFESCRLIFRKVLVDAGCDIFQSFEAQLEKIGFDQVSSVVEDIVDKIIQYYIQKEYDKSVDRASIVEALVLDKYSQKIHGKVAQYGRRNYNIMDLCENIGIVTEKEDSLTYYEKRDKSSQYGYRRLFICEKLRKVYDEVKTISTEFEDYVYTLDQQNFANTVGEVFSIVNKEIQIPSRERWNNLVEQVKSHIEKEVESLSKESMFLHRKRKTSLLCRQKSLTTAEKKLSKERDTAGSIVRLRKVEKSLEYISVVKDNLIKLQDLGYHFKLEQAFKTRAEEIFREYRKSFTPELEYTNTKETEGLSLSIKGVNQSFFAIKRFKSKLKKQKLKDVCATVDNFTGRQEQVKKICQELQKIEGTVVVITGKHGMGKTQLARKCAEKSKESYSHIYETEDSNMLSIESRFSSLTQRKLGMYIEETKSLIGSKKCLIICHNAKREDVEEIIKVEDRVGFDFLFTSLDQPCKGVVEAALGAFEEDQAVQLTKRILGIVDKLQDEQIKALVKKLEGFPLAIKLAAAYIRNSKLSNSEEAFGIYEYLIKYEDFDQIIPKNNKQSKYDRVLSITTSISMEVMEKKNDGIPFKCLRVMAHLGNSYIDPDMFLTLVELESIFELMENYSLLDTEMISRKKMYVMHESIKEVIRSQIAEDQREDMLLTAVEIFEDEFSNLEGDGTLHLIALVDHLGNYKTFKEEEPFMIRSITRLYSEGEYKEVIRLSTKVLPIVASSTENSLKIRYLRALALAASEDHSGLRELLELRESSYRSYFEQMLLDHFIVITYTIEKKYDYALDYLRSCAFLLSISDSLSSRLATLSIDLARIFVMKREYLCAFTVLYYVEHFKVEFDSTEKDAFYQDFFKNHDLLYFSYLKYTRTLGEFYSIRDEKYFYLTTSSSHINLHKLNSLILQESLLDILKYQKQSPFILRSPFFEKMISIKDKKNLLDKVLTRFNDLISSGELHESNHIGFYENPVQLSAGYDYPGKKGATQKLQNAQENYPGTVHTIVAIQEMSTKSERKEYLKKEIEKKSFLSQPEAVNVTIGNTLNIIMNLFGYKDNINLQDENDINSLHYTGITASSDIIKYPMDKWANVNLKFSNLLNIIHGLLEREAGINLQGKHGRGLLHYAVIIGHLNIVKYFVEKGADVNLPDENGMSPLHYAVIASRLDIVEYFLEQGATMSLEYKDLLRYHIATHDKSIKVQSIVFSGPCSSDLKVQSRKKQQKTPIHFSESKKRRLENISTTSEGDASNIQLFQNNSSDVSMQFEDLAGRTESMVSVTNETPMFLFDSVAVEPLNNKNLRR